MLVRVVCAYQKRKNQKETPVFVGIRIPLLLSETEMSNFMVRLDFTNFFFFFFFFFFFPLCDVRSHLT
jgi:hypothetical protein